MDTTFIEKLEGTPDLTAEKVVDLKRAYLSAADYYRRSGFVYCEGYADGLEEAVKILYRNGSDAVEDTVKSSHPFRKLMMIGAVVTVVVVYKKRKKNADG